MNIGTLDRKVEIYTKTKAQSSSGAVTNTRSLVTTLPARLMGTFGGEKSEQMRNTATHGQKFMIRYYSSLAMTHEIKFEGLYYDITGIQYLGRDAMIVTAETKSL